MKSTIEFDQQYIGRLAAFWDIDQRDRRGNYMCDPAAHVSEEAIFPAEYTVEQVIDECNCNADCFGSHVCICRIESSSIVSLVKRLEF